ncbi:unnamed protein product [Durusdinium trenchii]|uniref:Fatty acid desaturase domain-containing protein n=1 Tax=Durusdinium trenchii TaxID=1381693 RepID=A0ABP0T0S7_9DINO
MKSPSPGRSSAVRSMRSAPFFTPIRVVFSFAGPSARRPLSFFSPTIRPSAWRGRPWKALRLVPLLSQNFKAEVVAVLMLILFFSWCYCSYVLGCWRLNIALSWFWWRHLDAGLHAVMHGDFRTRHDIQAGLFWIYSLLSHRAMEYYYGARELKGNGMSKHWWHHIYPNDPGRDPDWSTMTGVAWVRRHTSAQWHPCHQWQCWYWLPVSMFLEPLFELIQVACALLEAVASLLEPPMNGPYVSRWAHVLGFLCEVLFNPGFQLVAFGVQPFWKALGVLLLARATSRLLLYPFSEVQHYMPEHILNREAADDSAEWVIGQLLCTANLEFRNRWAWLMDFLMFHGDSHQIEHHLWPAMSFVQYTKASQVVRATCARLRLSGSRRAGARVKSRGAHCHTTQLATSRATRRFVNR